MAQGSLLEQPVVVHTRPAIDMDDEQFFQFCQVNRDLQIERSAIHSSSDKIGGLVGGRSSFCIKARRSSVKG